jgi:hypothetical protein
LSFLKHVIIERFTQARYGPQIKPIITKIPPRGKEMFNALISRLKKDPWPLKNTIKVVITTMVMITGHLKSIIDYFDYKILNIF